MQSVYAYMHKIKLICFDVDGTLVDGNSWMILTEGLGCSLLQHQNIFQKAKRGEISFDEGERRLVKMYRNSKKANRSYIEKIFKQIKLRPYAKHLISYLNKNYIIYLISGAIDIYVQAIANKLDVNGFYANSKLEFDRNNILKKIHYQDKQGELKVKQLKDLLKSLKLTVEQTVFIGDSWNDVEVFKFIGKGIAVHCSDAELKKVTWKEVATLKQIQDIL